MAADMACDIKESLTKMFHGEDKGTTGSLDRNEVESSLKNFFSCPNAKEKWDDSRVKKETADFFESAGKKKDDAKVTLQEYIDYYTPRLSGSK
jgi:Ca2+-binding EF-hand superfamily protein